MELVCLGLNHQTAPVEVRERFAVTTTRLGEQARAKLEVSRASEVVVISTCNRTEFFLASPDPAAALDALQGHLLEASGTEIDLSAHFYRHYRMDALRHLCRVVSGLDSMMLGETEVFGQVKQAYQAALDAGTTSLVLNRVFQRAFAIGKKVRTLTRIQEGATSVGNVAVELASKIFGRLEDSEVMILGAGEMSRITAQNLMSRGARSIFVTNRSYERAMELAAETGGIAVRFDDWQRILERVDIVIASTGAPHFILRREDLEAVRRARKFRPLFLIDIAVPRDIDPEVGHIDEVYLYDIDTLEQIAEEGRGRRRLQIEQCEQIITSEIATSTLPGL
jgi:glutamyl-tRNA reductase